MKANRRRRANEVKEAMAKRRAVEDAKLAAVRARVQAEQQAHFERSTEMRAAKEQEVRPPTRALAIHSPVRFARACVLLEETE